MKIEKEAHTVTKHTKKREKYICTEHTHTHTRARAHTHTEHAQAHARTNNSTPMLFATANKQKTLKSSLLISVVVVRILYRFNIPTAYFTLK